MDYKILQKYFYESQFGKFNGIFALFLSLNKLTTNLYVELSYQIPLKVENINKTPRILDSIKMILSRSLFAAS